MFRTWTFVSQLKINVHILSFHSFPFFLFFIGAFQLPFSPPFCFHSWWIQNCFTTLHIFHPLSPPAAHGRTPPPAVQTSTLTHSAFSSLWKLLHGRIGWHNCSSYKKIFFILQHGAAHVSDYGHCSYVCLYGVHVVCECPRAWLLLLANTNNS